MADAKESQSIPESTPQRLGWIEYNDGKNQIIFSILWKI